MDSQTQILSVEIRAAIGRPLPTRLRAVYGSSAWYGKVSGAVICPGSSGLHGRVMSEYST